MCKTRFILCVKVENIAVDILLLMLHVTDILPSNLIIFKAEQDRAERRKKTNNRRSCSTCLSPWLQRKVSG